MNFSRKAFTLIELLVVIGIIAVVAALLLPSLSSAKAKSASTYCRNNERQIAVSLALYVSNSQEFPYNSVRPAPELTKRVRFWFDTLEATGASKWGSGIMKCPSYRGVWYDGSASPLGELPGCGSYSYNAYGGEPDAFQQPPRWVRTGLGADKLINVFDSISVKESDIGAPSEMYAIGDSQLHALWSPTPGQFGGASVYSWFEPLTITNPAVQHTAGLNISFVDGHVAQVRTNKLFSSAPSDRKHWNNDNWAQGL